MERRSTMQKNNSNNNNNDKNSTTHLHTEVSAIAGKLEETKCGDESVKRHLFSKFYQLPFVIYF